MCWRSSKRSAGRRRQRHAASRASSLLACAPALIRCVRSPDRHLYHKPTKAHLEWHSSADILLSEEADHVL